MSKKVQDAAEVVGGFLVIASLAMGAALLRVWFVMIMVGAIHSMVPGVPAIGFGVAAVVTLTLMVATWRPERSEK